MKRLAPLGPAVAALLALAAGLPPTPAFAGGEPASYTLADLDRMESDSQRAALAWLSRRQEDDGHWEAVAPGGHPLEKLYEPNAARDCDVLATALALCAFLGDGSTPWSGPYQPTVKAGWEWLGKQLQENGSLLPPEQEAAAESLSEREKQARRATVARLNHLWGTIALLETVACVERIDPGAPVTDAEKLRRRNEALPSAAKAFRFLWTDPSEKPAAFDFINEKTITMDELVLIAACRHIAGQNRVQHDKDWFDEAGARLKKIQTGQTEPWVPNRYTDEGEYWFRGTVATPQAMIAWPYFRIPGSMRHMQACAPLLLAHPPVWNPNYTVDRPTPHPESGGETSMAALPGDLRRVAGTWKDDIANESSWFWQAMAFRSLGGDDWNRWRNSIVPVLNAHQRRGGPESGSWDPVGPHARVFGREIATAWNAITLQSKCRLQMARTNWADLKSDPRQVARNENLGAQKNERVKCAVCGLETTTTTPHSKGRGAEIYYFCSDECAHKFEMDPTPYLKGAEDSGGGGGGGEGHEGSHK